jgi:DNA-directed RNA polymerase subunit H (RpoH/RPB5)
MADTPFETIDNLYRSRITLLDILEERGYEVTKFRKFSPIEIAAAAAAFPSLSFEVNKKEDAEKVCQVRYAKVGRQKLISFFEDIPEDNVPKTEVIVMMLEPVNDTHHQVALQLYLTRKLRVGFFSIFQLVNNPMRHVLVPKHTIVPPEEHAALLEKYHIPSKSKMPMIRFHVDPIIRLIGGVPGDIVKISRPSPTCGVYDDWYRVVTP